MTEPDTTGDEGRYAYEGLDSVLHSKARVGIVTALAMHPDGHSFNELARLCSLTDGNLSRHLDVLAEAGLIEIKKGFEGRRPQTTCRITAAGRKRFREYLAELEHVLRDATAAEEAKAPRAKESPGLAGA